MATTTMGGGRADRVADPAHQLPPRTDGSRARADGAGFAAPTGARGDREQPDVALSQLFRDLVDDSRRLIRDEIALAKHETRQTVRRVAVDGGWVAAGVAIGALGGICLTVGFALGLGALLGAYWLGAAIAGVLLLIAGGGMALKGIHDLREGDFAPSQTIDTLKQDAEWLRREASDLRHDMAGG